MKRLLTTLMFAAIACMLYADEMVTAYVAKGKYISEVAVSKDKNSVTAWNRLNDNNYQVISGNLNVGVSGWNYVFVGIRKTDNIDDAITDLIVTWHRKYTAGIYINSTQYFPVTGLGGYDGNLNPDNPGKSGDLAMFLHYTKGHKDTGDPGLTNIRIIEKNASAGNVGGYNGIEPVTSNDDHLHQDFNRRNESPTGVFMCMDKEDAMKGAGTASNPYQIKYPIDLVRFRNLSLTNGSVCAKLLTDINYRNQEWHPIGSYIDNGGYSGTFDGNNHTIYNIKCTNQNVHDAGFIGRGLGCTVKNLMIENVELKGKYRSAPVVGSCYKNTVINNCGVRGTINLGNGDFSAGLAYNECEKNYKLKVSNSYTTHSNLIGTKKEYLDRSTITNSYCNNNASFNTMSVKGELCHKLNGENNVNKTWRQKLDKDNYPTLNQNVDCVYKTGIVYHNGTLFGGNGDGTINNPFQITSANDLELFSSLVNKGYTTICGYLINDIDYSKKSTVENMIGAPGNPFKGSFSGNGKTITIGFKNINENNAGLFRFIDGATIVNLKIMGSLSTQKTVAGILVGNARGKSLISNIMINATLDASTYSGDITFGGFVGCVTGNATENRVTLKNCAFEGSFLGPNAMNGGGFVGWLDINGYATVENCYFAPQKLTLKPKTFYTFVRCFAKERYTINNSYFQNCGYEFDATTGQRQGTAEVTADQMSSGEICFKLNGSNNNNDTWLQNLGADPRPTLWNAKRVYYYGGTYANFKVSLPGSGTAADPFLIGTPQALETFRDLVNEGEGHPNLCARLTADIDMADRHWVPIGVYYTDTQYQPLKNVCYQGIFDGDGFVISNLSGINDGYHDMGLIGKAADGCCVMNVILHNVHFEGLFRCAAIIGYYNGKETATIENCGVTGIIQYSCSKGVATDMGGLACSENGNLSVYNSYTTYSNLVNYHGGSKCTIKDSYCGKDVENWHKSGELCYKLNGSKSGYYHWLQTIGKQDYPLQRTGKKVDYNSSTKTYSNVDFSDADNTPFSGNMSSDYFRVIHHGGRLYEFIITLGTKDGLGEHAFPNMEISYKNSEGAWTAIANLTNINREKLPFSANWSGEIATTLGTFIDVRTWQEQPPVFWIMQGNHTTRKEASLLWLAPEGTTYSNLSYFHIHDTQSKNVQTTSVRTTTDDNSDNSITVMTPYINATSTNAGSVATTVTTMTPVYSLGVWDANNNKFISVQEIPASTQNMQIALPHQDYVRNVTLLMYALEVTPTEDGMDTTYVTAATAVKVKPIHSISHDNVKSIANSKVITWDISHPKEGDLMEDDCFLVSRAYKADFSDITTLVTKKITDYQQTSEQDSLGYFSDSIQVNVQNLVKTDSVQSAFDDWTLPVSAKKILTAYKFNAHYVYYEVARAYPHAIWQNSELFCKRWKILMSKMLPRVDSICVDTLANFKQTHKVRLHLKLNNPYPHELVTAKADQDSVRAEAEKRGFSGRMFEWDDKVNIVIQRSSPSYQHNKSHVDEAAKTIVVKGSDVKVSYDGSYWYAEIEDIQSLPNTDYYYTASIDASASNYAVCHNMKQPVKTTYAEALKCKTSSLAKITNFIAVPNGKNAGEVALTWETDDSPNNKVTLIRTTYKCGYDNTMKIDTLKEMPLQVDGCSSLDTKALAGMVYKYKVTSSITVRDTLYSTFTETYGFSNYLVGDISGHVRMPNGTAMPSAVKVNIKSSQKLHINTVKAPNDTIVMPGYACDSLTTQIVATEDGYFHIDSLCYYGTGAQYVVSAQCDGATFTGPSGTAPDITLTLEDAKSSFANIDFTCRNVQQFSGRVLYEGTTIPVAGIKFKVNGTDLVDINNNAIVTDAKGNFTLTLPKYALNLQAYKEYHLLANDGWIFGSATEKLVPTKDYAQLNIADSTKIRLVGRIVGGDQEGNKPIGFGESNNILGDSLRLVLQLDGDNTAYTYYNTRNPEETSKTVTFEQPVLFRDQSTTTVSPTVVNFERKRIVIQTDEQTGEFCIDLAPARYKIAQMYGKGYGTLMNAESGLPVLDLTDSLVNTSHTSSIILNDSMTKKEMQTEYCAAFNHVYHAPIKVTLRERNKDFLGVPKATFATPSGTTSFQTVYKDSLNKVHYVFKYPIYQSNNTIRFVADAIEEYRYNNTPAGEYTQVPVTNGKFSVVNGFSTTPDNVICYQVGTSCFFNIKPNNTTFSFKGNNALMSLQVAVDVNGHSYEAEPLKAYVLGERKMGVEVEDAVEGAPYVLDVIRDPYGANSYAYREKGTQYNWTSHYESDFQQTLHLGVDAGVCFLTNFGFGALTGSNIQVSGGPSWDWTKEHTIEQKDGEYQLTLKDRMSTSSDVQDVGAMADIYLGNVSTMNVIRTQKMGIIDSITYAECKEAIDNGAIKVIAQGENAKGAPEYLVVASAVGLESGNSRMFAYTQKYIIGTLIPNLERRLSLCTSADSIKYNKQLKEWKKVIENNEKVKVSALNSEVSKTKLYSIAGATIEHSEEGCFYYRSATINGAKPNYFGGLSFNGKRDQFEKEKNADPLPEQPEQPEKKDGENLEEKKGEDEKKNSSSSWGMGFLIDVDFSWDRNTTVTNNIRNYTTYIAGSGYVLSSSDNSYIDMDVVTMRDTTFGVLDKDFVNTINGCETKVGGNSTDYYKETNYTIPLGADSTYVNNYVFIQRGGASRNPWMDADSTFFYKDNSGNRYSLGARSLRIDNPKIYVENPVVNNQPVDEPAIFTIRLANETEINDKSKYLNPSTLYLTVDEASNPDGAKLSIDGQPLRNGMPFYLNPGDAVTKTLEVRRGGKPMDYKNIKLQFTDNPDLWKLVDEAKISVHYAPVSSPVNISQPANNWLINTLSQVDNGNYYIPVQIDGFSATKYDNFDHIELQYKKQSESEDQWVNLCSFYTKPEFYEKATCTKQLIDSTATKIAYSFYGEKDPIEMKYDLRAVSFCRLGNGYVSRISNIVSGTKDTRCPEVFGKPKPVNGILTFSDVISLPFSEPIAYNYLDKTANFSVQGYTNNSDADHSAYIFFLGSNAQSAKTATEIATSQGDFTVEMMVKMDAEATDSVNFFSIENQDVAKTLNFGYLKKANCLFATFGNKQVKSRPINVNLTKSMTHVAFTYTATDKTVKFYVGEDEVLVASAANNLVCNATGPVMLGTNYKGAMTDARIWSRALSDSEVKIKYRKMLSTSERNLLAYWPMNETKGNVLVDKINGMNVTMNDISWQTPLGYSVRLEGRPMQILPKAAMKFTRNRSEDFTLGFWFKCDGSRDNSNAMLFCAGSDNLKDKGMDKMRIGFVGKDLVLKSDSNTISFGTDIDKLSATWHHAAVSVNHSFNIAALFIDGIMTQESNAENLGGITNSYVAFGDTAFYGNIDNVTFWNMALPASYLNQYYNVGCTGREPGLHINMNFEQTLTDHQGTPYTAFSPYNNVIVPTTGKIAGDTLVNESLVKTDTKIYAPVRSGNGIENLEFSWTSTNNELQININKTDASINNQQLNLIVRNVEDLNGNVMKNAQMWSVYVNRNVLAWNQDKLNVVLDYGQDTTLVMGWKNASGRVISYTIDNNVSWLQLASTMGTMQPLASEQTAIHISNGLAPGSYYTVINLIDENNLISKLPLNVVVVAKEPTWTVIEDEETMNVIGVVKKPAENGMWAVDMNPYDVVAAFIENKCVGKSYVKVDPVRNTSAVFLNIYGNAKYEAMDTPIEFRLWSADEGKIYQLETPYHIAFGRKDIIGTDKPVEMLARSVNYQTFELKKGWNWVSLNVEPIHEEGVENLFSDISQLTPGDIIKSPDNEISVLQRDRTWDDELEDMSIEPSNVYQIYVQQPATITAVGAAFTDQDRVVDLCFTPQQPWSDLAYLLETPQPINQALVDFAAGSSKAPAGTIIKARNEFAVASQDGHWVGSLEYLRPGLGYYVMRTLVTDTIVVPVKYINPIASEVNTSQPTSSLPSTSVSTSSSSSMPIIATFAEGEYEEGDVLLAIANGEVVGAAEARSTNAHSLNARTSTSEIFFLSASTEPGSNLQFVKMRDGEPVAVSTKRFIYNADIVAGTLEHPYVVDFTATEGNDIYDLSGIKHFSTKTLNQRGIYIQNGRKVSR